MMSQKKILLLGPRHQRIVDFLTSFNDAVVTADFRIEDDPQILEGVDFIVSYRYKHIIRNNVVDNFGCRAINLHSSLLPWNRGSDPTLWSFLEDTPKGVTIHCIDNGIDTGRIIAQREVALDSSETLRSAYDKLSLAMEDLFFDNWSDIRARNIVAKLQPVGGSFHRLRDRIPFEHLLTMGWDTPVAGLIGKAANR